MAHIILQENGEEKVIPAKNDFIGTEFISKRIKLNFKNVPTVEWEKEKYYLANLHVHSKRMENFLPVNYREY